MKTVFLRVIEAEDKAAALLEAVQVLEQAHGPQRFEVDVASFGNVPRSPFAYWVSERLRRLFKELPAFETEGRTAKQGLATADDFRFVRAWWAVPASQAAARWFPIVKGGRFSPHYANVPTVVNWGRDGAEPKAWASSLYNQSHWSRILKNTDLFFRPGLTWPLRGVRFSAQAVPRGCVFSVAGKMAFAEADELLWFLALFNSSAFDKFIAFFAGKVGGVQYEVGLIQNVPVPRPPIESMLAVAAHARRSWSLKRYLDTSIEISRAFALPALLQVEGTQLASRAAAWAKRIQAVQAELTTIQLEIDAHCFELYGIDEADRRSITEGFAGPDSESESSADASEVADDASEEVDESESAADEVGLAAELVSWAVGVAFGRFDIRLATKVLAIPTEPDPFDPLPACAPGMLTGGDGLPLARPPIGYPFAFPESGVLVDDLGHAQDLQTAVRVVFDTVFAADADRWWTDVGALLDPKGHDLRVWLAGSFFEHHLKRHSKSRRKAPIFWQIGTPAGRYSIWLYAHRLTRDTFFQLQNDVVGPKLTHEERQLTDLMQNAGGSPSLPERKDIAAQEAVVEELRAMLNEVKCVAPLWNPNLDDGVVLTMAPLWRLVPQHKPWQKELKAKWNELAAEKYDWAHLAMHIWPERVVPKCAIDRSLAIAHGLEDEFWLEGADGKWMPRTPPLKSIDELVRQRSSPAVKAALKSLLDAPTASSNGRTRGRRAGAPAVVRGRSR